MLSDRIYSYRRYSDLEGLYGPQRHSTAKQNDEQSDDRYFYCTVYFVGVDRFGLGLTFTLLRVREWRSLRLEQFNLRELKALSNGLACSAYREAQMQKEFVLDTEPGFFFAVPVVA